MLKACGLGLNVIACVHKNFLKGPLIRCLSWPLEDHNSFVSRMEQCRPDWVIHCAACTDVDHCEEQPEFAFRLNAVAAGEMARATANIGAAFAYISTDSVFCGEAGKYAETDPPSPINTYARSKLAGEERVFYAHSSALVVRSNLFGWNAQRKQSLAEWILNRLEAGKTVPGFSDVWFNPLHAADLADVILQLLDRGTHGLLHAGSADACSKYEFARIVAETFEKDVEQVKLTALSDVPMRASRPMNTVLDVTQICSLLGRGMPTIREGVQAMRDMEKEGGRVRLNDLIGEVVLWK